MKQTLAKIAQSVTPPVLWNVYQRARRHTESYPWRQFGSMLTCADAKPLLEGKFADLYAKYQPLNPVAPAEKDRYRHYNLCYFAERCRHIPGDFVCAGVSWGVGPRIIFDFVDFASLGKKFHLIDPFEGTISSTGEHATGFNCDPDYVLRQYPPDAPIVLHRKPIPVRLNGKLAFVSTDTADPAADAESLPIFYEALNPGGIFVSEQYADNIHYYEPILRRLGATALWLPSGQGVIVKR